ncbi:MAG: PilT/PilU family type 4a pilus ATPase [Pyrinomonadaceae bacterium]
MEKLNEYLQMLLSTCSYELRLEPNKTPYVVNAAGETEVANLPLLGTQISTIIFPLIPAEAKQQLPNKPEIEFVHKHNLGSFSFLVKKSPAGFNVIIRPMLSDGDSGQTSPAAVSKEPPLTSASQNYYNPGSNAYPPVRAFNEPAGYQNQPKKEQAPAQPEQAESEPQNVPAENYHQPVKTESSEQQYDDFYDYSATNSIQIEDVEPEYEKESESMSNNSSSMVFEPEYAASFSGGNNFEMPVRPQDFTMEYEQADQTPVQSSVQAQNFQSAQVVEDDFTPATPPRNSPPPQPPGAAFVGHSGDPQARGRMDALFHKMAEAGSSDLHMSVSMPPMIRKDGKMMKLESDEGVLTPETMKALLQSIMPAKNIEEFESRRDTDFAYEIEGLARFRANIFMDRKGMGGVFRIIPTKILTAEQLGLSKAIMDLCSLSKGLVVVTGPTGSGKSTTLCAMIDSINKTREDHIITIEDPIEFVHDNQKCLVNQREVHNHTSSFKDALRAALREDPDILLVGEMRDLETISIAIETAETGHLVFGTLHTTTAASTVDRIIDQFPADRQQQVRVMLSESLRGVIAQTLLPKKGGGRVAALEILIVTPAISNLIREGKTFQIPSAMQTGKNQGMVMLNDALMDLVKKGLVEPRDAYIKAVDKAGLESLLQRNGMKI